MDALVYVLPVLGCAAMMGVMWWMMRGRHGPANAEDPAATDPGAAEVARLRAEIAELRGQQRRGPDEHAGPSQ